MRGRSCWHLRVLILAALQAVTAHRVAATTAAAPKPAGWTFNTTELDCGMRRLIQERIVQEHPHRNHRETFDALQLSQLCGDTAPPNRTFRHTPPSLPLEAVFVSPDGDDSNPGTQQMPVLSLHRAAAIVAHQPNNRLESDNRTIVLTKGVHFLNSTLKLGPEHAGTVIMSSAPGETWISGGLKLPRSQNWTKSTQFEDHLNVWETALPGVSDVPGLFLVEPHIRFTKSRYPNANAETAQWGYASVLRDQYSLAAEAVSEWWKPPKGALPDFDFIDLSVPGNPSGAVKNDSTMDGYNTYSSGRGGVCNLWTGDSYWCSNNSAGGWAEVDQECAVSGQLQIPIGMTYDHRFEHDGKSLGERFGKWKSNVSGAWVHAWHSQSWALHVFEVDSMDSSNHSLNFGKGGQQGGRNWCRCDQCGYAGPWCTQHQSPPPKQVDTRLISGSWFIEGIREELDTGGEFHFDATDSKLYFMPNSTEHRAPEGEFTIPVLQRLVEITGSQETPVRDITISGVGFRDAATTLMEDWGAPSGGDWSIHRGAAVFLEGVEEISITNCTFQRLDGNAVFLSRYTRGVTIDNNEFAWIGNNAMATWGDTNGYDATEGKFPQRTLVSNNWIHELGIYEKQSSGWGQAKTAMTTLRNNVMFNMPRAAINFNDHLGGGDVVDSNIIFNTCRPINSWDRMPFLTNVRDPESSSFTPASIEIKNNLIVGNYGASQGVDNDDGSSWFLIHHNVFYAAEGFKMDYGGHNSKFFSNLVVVMPYDGSNCINVGSFKKDLGHEYYNNTCISGVSEYSEPSGCGSPACANSTRVVPNMDKIGGAAQCQPGYFRLAGNRYYSPHANASMSCGGKLLSITEVQNQYHNEFGSTFAGLPKPVEILDWTRQMLK